MKSIKFVFNSPYEYFELDGNVDILKLNFFFEQILKENKIDNSNIYEDIIKQIKENRLVYPGEICFYENDNEIYTGCCFEINDINRAYDDMINFKTPWLGHDPDTTAIYEDDKIIICSDYENEAEEIASTIIYTKNELINEFSKANDNLKEFIGIFNNYLKTKYANISDTLIEDFKQKLL